jgi:hypothetical protein
LGRNVSPAGFWLWGPAGRILAVGSSGAGASPPRLGATDGPSGVWLLISAGFSGRSRVGGSGAMVIPHAYRPKTAIAGSPSAARGKPSDPSSGHPRLGDFPLQCWNTPQTALLAVRWAYFSSAAGVPEPRRTPFPSQTGRRPAPEAPIETPKASHAVGDTTRPDRRRMAIHRQGMAADCHSSPRHPPQSRRGGPSKAAPSIRSRTEPPEVGEGRFGPRSKSSPKVGEGEDSLYLQNVPDSANLRKLFM